MDRWLRHEMRELMYDTLCADSLRCHGLFNTQYVQKLMNDHTNGATNNGVQLFMLMVFQLWHDKYIHNFKLNTLPNAELIEAHAH